MQIFITRPFVILKHMDLCISANGALCEIINLEKIAYFYFDRKGGCPVKG